MYPELFKIGPFTVYSYGLMLGIAFITASWILTKEIERKKLNANIATEITILAIIFGIIGAKLFHLFENFDAFLEDPVGMAFSPGGLTFFGGLIVAVMAIWIYARQKKIRKTEQSRHRLCSGVLKLLRIILMEFYLTTPLFIPHLSMNF